MLFRTVAFTERRVKNVESLMLKLTMTIMDSRC